MAYSRTHANRGKFLENLIDMANDNYLLKDIADIRKVPTPFKPLNTKAGKVTGHFEKPTWVDYSGIYEGKAIIFDAKQTAETAFPLSKLSQHQYNLLKSWHQKGARAFLLVYFSQHDKYFILLFDDLELAWERAEMGGRKSIAYKEFQAWGYEVRSKDGYALHYLEAI